MFTLRRRKPIPPFITPSPATVRDAVTVLERADRNARCIVAGKERSAVQIPIYRYGTRYPQFLLILRSLAPDFGLRFHHSRGGTVYFEKLPPS